MPRFLRPLIALALLLAPATAARAQQQLPARVDIAWNRFYDVEEITEHLRALAAAHPELLELEEIGRSEQDRPIWLVTLNNPETGAADEKPAMWIDGNIHGNEVQAAETVLYSIWYLVESYGRVAPLTELVDRAAFYFVPMSNPDGRAGWFEGPTTPHSFRTGLRPTDNDFDGLLDEDGPEDLDGDGHIGQMWRRDPHGTHRRDPDDPRRFERVGAGERGEWSYAGQEGIDDDGDGRINEDGPGGYDMNRNWPSGWQPSFVQRGAGDHAFDRPETAAIGRFILAHPNIAAGQSYHNTGGMILRGPGAAHRDTEYPRADLRVYDELARAGVEMLPFYDYLVIHADLYTVHGGFVTWLSEGLGIVSFTNELWTDDRILQTGDRPSREQRWHWLDRVLFGQTFTDWTEHEHPTLGPVLIGGGTKWASRTPPPFMLEEECHRNFAFTMFHAEHMPLLSLEWVEVERLDGTLWQITVEVGNDRIIPTRTAIADERDIGQPDRLELRGEGVEAVASGALSSRFARTMEPGPRGHDRRPGRIDVDAGIPGRGHGTFRFLATGPAGAEVTLAYRAEKARDVALTFTLAEGEHGTLTADDDGP